MSDQELDALIKKEAYAGQIFNEFRNAYMENDSKKHARKKTYPLYSS